MTFAAWASPIAAAAVATGPAYLALRRSRTSAQSEGQATREAVSSALETAVASLGGRLDGVRDELRSDIHEVRDWQAAHTAEHAVNAYGRPRLITRGTNE